MSDPFIAEIRIFACNFAPKNWALCAGQLMLIQQNAALFSLLGTYYGGNGQNTFALPDLQGRAPMMFGHGAGLSAHDYPGDTGGAEYVTLITSEIPSHTHPAMAVADLGDSNTPGSTATWAEGKAGRQMTSLYTQSAGNNVALSPQAFAQSGGGQPHNNMPPYLALNFCICLGGYYPPRW